MEYIIIGICVVVVVAICVTVFLEKKARQTETKKTTSLDTVGSPTSSMTQDDSSHEVVIQMEMLPVEDTPDENKLVEITDSKVLAHVNNLVPGLAQVGNAANNAVQAIAQSTASMITAQLAGHEETHHHDTTDLYAEDVQLIAKNGKVYYLPESKAE